MHEVRGHVILKVAGRGSSPRAAAVARLGDRRVWPPRRLQPGVPAGRRIGSRAPLRASRAPRWRAPGRVLPVIMVLHIWGMLSPDFTMGAVPAGRSDDVDALTQLGVADSGLGPVRGEYCDGAWSVNLACHAKVAGTGERLYLGGFLVCAALR